MRTSGALRSAAAAAAAADVGEKEERGRSLKREKKNGTGEEEISTKATSCLCFLLDFRQVADVMGEAPLGNGRGMGRGG